MLGSASILALWLLAATPTGAATANDGTDDGLAIPTSFQTPDSAQRALIDERRLPSAPGPLPPGLAYYEDKHLPTTDDQQGIPGLPPVPDDTPAPVQTIPKRTDKPKPPRIIPKPAGDAAAPTYDLPPVRNADVYVRPEQQSRFRKWLDAADYDAWIDQGVTLNTLSPRDRSNGPVTFNNRSNEYQLNQAYFRLKRDADLDGDAWDLGGRIDLLYGTDSFYAVSRGLETFDDFSPKWNAQQYGLALPQAYAEVVAPWGNGVSVKMGHFYSGFGYEAVTPLDNFFYSHSYVFQYGEPFSYTGFIGSTKLGQFTLEAGMNRGWDNWDDNNNDLAFMGGVNWESCDKRTKVIFDIDAGRQQSDPSTNVRTIYALVLQQKIGDRWEYVIQNDYGSEPGAGAGGTTACWYGIDQYLFYTINERWKAGMRFEWFHDHNGARVPNPNAVLQTGDYYELTAGVNWKPHKNVVVRPELRYDWTGTPGLYPFGDGARSSQFLVDCDVVVRF